MPHSEGNSFWPHVVAHGDLARWCGQGQEFVLPSRNKAEVELSILVSNRVADGSIGDTLEEGCLATFHSEFGTFLKYTEYFFCSYKLKIWGYLSFWCCMTM